MRVCVITTVHPPNDIRISKELDTLSKAGYEVIYIAKKGKFENDKITYWPITEYHGRLNRLIFKKHLMLMLTYITFTTLS